MESAGAKAVGEGGEAARPFEGVEGCVDLGGAVRF